VWIECVTEKVIRINRKVLGRLIEINQPTDGIESHLKESG
jgi:hypothetical protein